MFIGLCEGASTLIPDSPVDIPAVLVQKPDASEAVFVTLPLCRLYRNLAVVEVLNCASKATVPSINLAS